MSNKPCLLDWTVLDLCEETYHGPYGTFCDTIRTFDLIGASAWKLIVVCLNAELNDQSQHYDFVLDDYAPFRIQPLPFDMKVQDILNCCKARELPIVAEVNELGEKCLIIAACREPWIQWFELLFGDVEEETRSSGVEALRPTIVHLLRDINRRKREDSSQ